MSATPDVLHAPILIVDDQQSNLRLLEYVLRRAGHASVASTAEPTQVCALHRENQYDLIMLDLQMPRMNGFQVMEELAKAGNGKSAVILVLSADPAQMTRALEAGAAGFMSKPFVLAEVVARVQAMLRFMQTPPTLLLATA
jgi:DNA-binding response OmpR family regulator